MSIGSRQRGRDTLLPRTYRQLYAVRRAGAPGGLSRVQTGRGWLAALPACQDGIVGHRHSWLVPSLPAATV